MLSYARDLVWSLWYRPDGFVAGVASLVIASVIATAGVPALARRNGRAGSFLASIRSPVWTFLAFCLTDWLLLEILPLLELSFAHNTLLCLSASLVVRVGLLWGLVAAALPAQWSNHRSAPQSKPRRAIMLFVIVNLAFSAVQIDAYVVEPLLVETTELSLVSADLDPAAPPVRIVHLTDTHIERSSFRERAVVKKVNELQPDIIVFTGDYINTSYHGDTTAHEHFREFVTQLKAPYGIYATRGTVEPSLSYMAHLIKDTDIVWLEQEAVTVDVRGQQVTLVGANCDHNRGDVTRLDQAMTGVVSDDGFTMLLFHSPDLIKEAAAYGIDLYVGGHTHGGQLRLPFYGAIVTASKYGKQYEAGLYQEGDTTMYISRGIGFEGSVMPRARFLCRPEIVSIELEGAR
jgi:predicted MPP superfamily phosphohydrolase